MNMEIVFATGNPHKIEEVAALVPAGIRLISLADIGCPGDLPETAPTIAGNALQKARYVFERFGVNCFAEDTGLEIDALGGEPGVFSARYAGPQKDAKANMQLVLDKLSGVSDRRARFRTVIALVLDGDAHTFEGIAEGRIAERPAGAGGFGYDPIFVPAGQAFSFAQMDAGAKNAVSHRGKAVALLVEFLRNL